MCLHVQGVQSKKRTLDHGKLNCLTLPHLVYTIQLTACWSRCWKWPASTPRPAWQLVNGLLNTFWNCLQIVATALLMICLSSSCLPGLLWYMFPFKLPHMWLDQGSAQATNEDNLFDTKTRSVGQPLNCTVYGRLHSPAGRTHSPSPQHFN